MSVEINGIKQNKLLTEVRTDAYNTETNTRTSYSLEYTEETPMGSLVTAATTLPDKFKERVDSLFEDLNVYYQNK